MDYFDEAGPEREDEVIRIVGLNGSLLSVPIAGHLKNGGEFTGYQDERFRDPNHQVAGALTSPERQEKGGITAKRTTVQTEPSQTGRTNRITGRTAEWAAVHDPKTQSRFKQAIPQKIISWVIFIIIISPMPISGGVLALQEDLWVSGALHS